MKWFMHTKYILELCVYLIAIISFWYGRHLLRYKLDEPTRKLYFENCFKVQIVLDKFTRTGIITLDDINTLALANQEAEFYLNNEIVDLTKKIWDTTAHYHSFVEENEKTGERNHIEELDIYRKDLYSYKKNLTNHYRKYLVYDKPKWLKYIGFQFDKLRSK